MKTFLAASDFHFPHADRRAVAAFVKDVEEQQPSFVVLNGDLLDGADLAREYIKYRAFLAEIRRVYRGEVLAVVGNHDEAHGLRVAKNALQTGVAARVSFRRGPFTFVHGSFHSELYAEETHREWFLRSHRGVYVVGHSHRPQYYQSGGAAVLGLPCMAKQGVPGAALGWARGWWHRSRFGVETVVVG